MFSDVQDKMKIAKEEVCSWLLYVYPIIVESTCILCLNSIPIKMRQFVKVCEERIYMNSFSLGLTKNIIEKSCNSLKLRHMVIFQCCFYSPIGQEYPFLQVCEIFLSWPAVLA